MRKFENCDILAVLGEIVTNNTKHYQSDFEIDKEILAKAAEEKNVRDREYLWMSRPCGTHCLKEKDVFLKGTSEHHTWTAYARQASEIVAYAIRIRNKENEIIKGDLYELDYAKHCEETKKKAFAVESVRIHCKAGEELIFPYKEWFSVSSRYEYDERELLPADPEDYAELLNEIRAERLNTNYFPWDERKLKLEFGDLPTFRIYQLKDDANEGLFLSYHTMKERGWKIDKANYELAYIGEDSAGYSLDDLYEKFNLCRPSDFCGHSLSVSDVIAFSGNGTVEAYYVDDFGFEPLPKFFNAAQKKPTQM